MLKFQIIDALYRKWRFFTGGDTKIPLLRIESVILLAIELGVWNFTIFINSVQLK